MEIGAEPLRFGQGTKCRAKVLLSSTAASFQIHCGGFRTWLHQGMMALGSWWFRNPATVTSWGWSFIPLFTGFLMDFYTFQVVKDFWTINSITSSMAINLGAVFHSAKTAMDTYPMKVRWNLWCLAWRPNCKIYIQTHQQIFSCYSLPISHLNALLKATVLSPPMQEDWRQWDTRPGILCSASRKSSCFSLTVSDRCDSKTLETLRVPQQSNSEQCSKFEKTLLLLMIGKPPN